MEEGPRAWDLLSIGRSSVVKRDWASRDVNGIRAGCEGLPDAAPFEDAGDPRREIDGYGLAIDADFDCAFGVGDGAAGAAQLAEMRPDAYAGKAGGGGIDAEDGAEELDVGAGAPCVTVR